MDFISREKAIKLCQEVRRENRRKWFSTAYWQCWGCVTFTKSNPDKMCLRTAEGYNGCALVNRRFTFR